MTHRRNKMGREIHPDDTVRYRRRFTALAISMVVIGALPPTAIVLVPVWILIARDERRRWKAQHEVPYAQQVIARGRRQV